MRDERPWGSFDILLDEKTYKVKRITVLQGKRLSLQYHNKRSEHWHIVAGEALVTLGGNNFSMKTGESVDIPRGAQHRIQNIGNEPMVFIEIQRGDYFGEDDIVRVEDDFGRNDN